MLTACSGCCSVCVHYGKCDAKPGDDWFDLASKEELEERFRNTPKSREYIKAILKELDGTK